MKPNEIALKLLFTWFCIANILTAFLVWAFSFKSVVIYAIKDAPYYIVFCYALFIWFVSSPLTLKRHIIPVAFGLTYLISNFVMTPVEMVSFAAAMRQLAGFFIVFYASRSMSRDVTLNKFISYIQIIAVVVIVLCWVELFFGLWKMELIRIYFETKSIGIVESGYPFHFIEPLKEPLITLIGKQSLVRATSIFLDPINLGHMLVFWIVTAWFYGVPRTAWLRYTFIVVCGITLLLTFSKGAWLQLALCLGIFNHRLSHRVRLIALMCIFAVFTLGFMFLPGGLVHFIGLVNGLQTGGLVGKGLGMVGNYAIMLDPSLDPDI